MSSQEDTEEEISWWDTTTLSTARRAFRKALQDRAPLNNTWRTWLEYFIMGNIAGSTRFPALCLLQLVEQAEARGQRLERELPRQSLAGLTRISFRALLALAEQPDVPLEKVEVVANVVKAFFAHDACTATDHAVLNLNLAPRLGQPRAARDIKILRQGWREDLERMARANGLGKEDPAATDGSLSAVCMAMAGQTLVESLIEIGDEKGAIACLDEAWEQEACCPPCGQAPQGLLIAGLSLFPRHGLPERAAQCEQKLAMFAPAIAPWLACAGARMMYLARMGEHERANNLRQQTLGLTDHPELSKWHLLRYHFGADHVLRDAVEMNHYRLWQTLAKEFDDRNGTSRVSADLHAQRAPLVAAAL